MSFFLLYYTTMVVYFKQIDLSQLDLGYLALFLGQRVNELVVQRLVRAGFQNVRASHGYVVQHLIEKERSITELAQRMGVTQQAASKTVSEMVRLGILAAKPVRDRRAKGICISKRGWESVRLSRRARAQIDRRLVKTVGAEEYRRTKACLTQCLETLGGVRSIQSRRVKEP